MWAGVGHFREVITTFYSLADFFKSQYDMTKSLLFFLMLLSGSAFVFRTVLPLKTVGGKFPASAGGLM